MELSLCVLVAAVLIAMGSSVFHPESSSAARMASAGQNAIGAIHFSGRGNVGTAVGPLLAAAFIVPMGQPSVAWVALAALVGMLILYRVSRWYAVNLTGVRGRTSLGHHETGLSPKQVKVAIAILLVLLFSKFIYMSSLNSYFTFYLIHHFGLDIQSAQYCLFIFLLGAAIGTIIGGPIGDRIGRKHIIPRFHSGCCAVSVSYCHSLISRPHWCWCFSSA